MIDDDDINDTGSVLPQATIDALFKQATGKDIAQPPEAKPTAPSATSQPPVSPVTPSTRPPQRAEPVAPSATPVQTPAPVPSDEVLKTLQATMTDLAQRITKVETSINRLSQKETEVPDASVPVQRLSQRLEAVVKDLQQVNSQVGRVLKGLEGTPDYGVRNSFTCESCGSHGFVAIPMRCTKCDGEGWWGWWPKKEMSLPR